MQAQAADASAVLSAVRRRAIGPCADQLSHAEIDPATIVDDVPVENMLPGRIAARCPMRSRCRRARSSTQRLFTSWRVARLARPRTMIGEYAQLDIRCFRPNIFVETAPGGVGFLAGCGKTRFMHKTPLESSIWRRCHNSLRMLKKARLLTRPALARRDAPCPKQGRNFEADLISRFTVHGSWERSENAAGGLFQHPARG